MVENNLLEEIRQRVEQAFAGKQAEIEVSTDGYHYSLSVVSPVFVDMRPVARQQLVYKALADLITSGTLHAINIRAVPPP